MFFFQPQGSALVDENGILIGIASWFHISKVTMKQFPFGKFHQCDAGKLNSP